MDYRKLIEGEYYVPVYNFIRRSGLNLSEQHILSALIKFRMNEPSRRITLSYLNDGAFTKPTIYNAKKSLIEKGYITSDLQWTGKKEPVNKVKALKLDESLLPYFDVIPDMEDIKDFGIDYWNEVVKNQTETALQNKKNGIKRR